MAGSQRCADRNKDLLNATPFGCTTASPTEVRTPPAALQLGKVPSIYNTNIMGQFSVASPPVASWARVRWVAVVAALVVGLGSSPARAEGAGGAGSGVEVDASVSVGGFSGGVDVRTGGVSGSLTMAGGLGAGWNQAAVGSDRYGMGNGWGWMASFLDATAGVVFPGVGGQYSWDLTAGAVSGLRDFVGEGMRFERATGTLPGRPGVAGDGDVDGAERSYGFRLLYTESGSTEYFNVTGDVIAVVDRAGVRTDWVWQAGDRHRLVAVVDEWGNVTEVSYSSGRIVVKAPASDVLEVAPVTTLSVESGKLRQVTGAVGAVTKFGYGAVSGGSGEFLTQISSGGLVGRLSYSRLSYQQQVVTVSRVEVTDVASGMRVVPDRVFSVDPVGDRRNFTGYVHGGAGFVAQGLFGSGADYRYVTSAADGWVKVTRSYNSNHLLVREMTELTAGPQRGIVGETVIAYTGQTDPDRPLGRDGLVPNWSKPRSVTHTVHDPSTTRKKTATVSMSYDGFGRVTLTDDGVTTTTTEYGAYGFPIKTVTTGTDGLVVEEVNTLTADGRHIAETVTRQTPTGGGELAQTSQTRFEYGNTRPILAGSPTAVTRVGTDGSTLTTRVAAVVDRRTLTTTEIDPGGVATARVVDVATGLLVSATDGSGRVRSYEYDVAGRPTAVTGADGLTTKTRYALRAAGDSINAVATINPGGYTTRVVYDSSGRRVATQDNYTPSTGRVAEGTDQTGLADVSVGSDQDADGWRTLTQTRYGERGLVEQAADQAGRVTRTEYDASGIPVKVTAPDGTVTTQYDAIAGIQSQTLTPHGSTKSISTTHTVDDRGNPLRAQVDYSDGTPAADSTVRYDTWNRPLTQTATGRSTTTTYPGYGHPSITLAGAADSGSTRPPVRSEVSTTGFGQRIQKVLTDGTDTVLGVSLSYDAAGRVNAETDQVGKVWSTAYDPTDGAVDSVTRPDGAAAYTLRDDSGRVEHTFVMHPGGDPNQVADRIEWVQHEYHPETGMLAARFDPNNRPETEIRYEYYPDGTPKQTTYPDGARLQWAWAATGELYRFTDAAGAITTHDYDPDTGRLVSAVNHTPTGEQIAQVAFTYTEFGRPATIARDNGALTRYEYDQAGHVVTETHTDGAGNLMTTIEYSYDTSNNLVGETLTTGTGHPAGTTTELRTHEYDYLNRLTATSTYPGIDSFDDLVDKTPPAETISYRYDLASQLTRTTHTTRPGTDQAQSSTTEFTLDPAGKPLTVTRDGVTTPTRTYDDNGNLLDTADGTTHTYTPTGQAHTTRTSGSGQNVTVTNEYWVDGTLRTETTRIGDHAPVVLTSYWDTTTHTPTLVNQKTLGGVTSSYLMGLTRAHRALLSTEGALYEDQTGAGYFHTNAQSSTLALTNQQGVATHTYQYGDYGTLDPQRSTETTEAEGIHRNPHQYTGGYATPTGHLKLGTRHYDPTTTFTFTTRDTANTLARYAYAAANPHTNTDPTGTTPTAQTWLALGLGAAAFVGTIISIVATGGIATPKFIAWAVTAIFLAMADFAIQAVIATGSHEGYLNEEQLNILEPVSLAVGLLAAITSAVAASYAVQAVSKAGQASHAVPTTSVSPITPPEPVPPVPSVSPPETSTGTPARSRSASAASSRASADEEVSEPGDVPAPVETPFAVQARILNSRTLYLVADKRTAAQAHSSGRIHPWQEADFGTAVYLSVNLNDARKLAGTTRGVVMDAQLNVTTALEFRPVWMENVPVDPKSGLGRDMAEWGVELRAIDPIHGGRLDINMNTPEFGYKGGDPKEGYGGANMNSSTLLPIWGYAAKNDLDAVHVGSRVIVFYPEQIARVTLHAGT